MYFKNIIISLLILLFSQVFFAQIIILDDFNTAEGWNYIKPEGGNDIKMNVSTDKGRTGTAIRLDYDFTKGTGYSGLQKFFPLNLPENYEISFWVKGNAPANNFEFKLVDASGDNVWMINRRNFTFPSEWVKIKIKKRNIDFAWGPNFSAKPPRIDRIEFTIASMVGGKGTIWIDDLKFESLPPESTSYPEPTLIFSQKSKQNTLSDWVSKNNKKQSIQFDFKQKREIGGLNILWNKVYIPSDFMVSISDDAKVWEPIYSNQANLSQNDIIRLDDVETQFLKLDLNKTNAKKFGINSFEFIPANEVDSRNKFFIYSALNSKKGDYPSYFLKQASFFTVSGVNNDTQEALISENGMVELEKGKFSVEPILISKGKLYNWHNVAVSQTMGNDLQPENFTFLPGVDWKMDHLKLSTEITSNGEANVNSNLYIKYSLTNTSDEVQNVDFLLLIRPFQVNPYYQNLNLEGGVGSIENIKALNDQSVLTDNKTIYSSLPFQHFSSYTSKDGNVVELLKNNHFNNKAAVTDTQKLATGVMQYNLTLQPQETKMFYLKSPYHDTTSTLNDITNAAMEKDFNQGVEYWKTRTNHIKFNLPASADKIIDTYKSQLVYILINRDKAGIQPGSRSYERSWIRDGSLTSSALMKSGIVKEVREYIDWYSGFLYEDGKVPCVVDKRGPDPVPENDSHGQFIYAIKEYYNFTKDVNFLKAKNEKVLKAVSYIEKLIAQRSTDHYKNGNDSIRAQYGLVPESISHEGYSAKPMHSYWDDFFTLKGLKDAVEIQKLLGNNEEEQRIAKITDTFTKNLYNSIHLAMKNHNIDYIPGCAELGDFDATSTTVALTPVNEFANLPQPQIYNTFDKYYDYFVKRKNNTINWVNYTPYENRVIGSFIMLNEPKKAHELIEFFLNDLKPKAWNHWSEVVWKDDRFPGYVGDMPHTWVGSDFVNAIRSMFVYENEMDESLVLAAALYQDWIDTPNGMSINNLPTYFGEVSYSIKKEGNKYEFSITGDLKLPKKGLKIQNFNGSKMPTKVVVNGVEIKSFTNNVIQIQEVPVKVEIYY